MKFNNYPFSLVRKQVPGARIYSEAEWTKLLHTVKDHNWDFVLQIATKTHGEVVSVDYNQDYYNVYLSVKHMITKWYKIRWENAC